MEFTQEESAAMRAEYGKGSTDTQWELFLSECKARNLRPGTHLIFQLRSAKEYDPSVNASVFVKKAFWITSISALRLIAQRTGEYLGQGPEEYIYLDDKGLPTVVSNIPLPDPENKALPREPWVVRTKVYRKGFTEPMIGVARFEAYAGTYKASDNKIRLTEMWSKRGSEQLSKCSEALALRKAFPEEMGSLYIAEELKHEEEPSAPAEPVALAPAPSLPVVPQVNQTPAEPTTAPRPGEEKIPTLVEIILDKPAAEPEKPKRGRKPKVEPAEPAKPFHDQPELGITDADIAVAYQPIPEFDAAANTKEAQDFAEDVCSATPVPDRLPEKEQQDKYVTRVRELVKTHGVSNADVGAYVFKLSNKKSSKELTIGNWDAAFEKLDAAAAAGTLKELVKQ